MLILIFFFRIKDKSHRESNTTQYKIMNNMTKSDSHEIFSNIFI